MKNKNNTTCKVYKITCIPTNKIYVGITTMQYLSQRFWRHVNRPGSTSYLHNCIHKYGEKNFTIELLHECKTPVSAKKKERYLIKKRKLNKCRYPNGIGMNLTDGGDGSYGMRHTAKSIKQMSGKNNHNYGLVGKLNPTSKPVHQYTRDGKFITTHAGFYEAARTLKPGCTRLTQSSVGSNIRTAILRNITSYGYKWAYA
jgi:group I intron endonuclease